MANPEIGVWVDQHVYEHHGRDPGHAFQSLMGDSLDYNQISNWGVILYFEEPIDGRDYDKTTEIHSAFHDWIDTNYGTDNHDVALLIFDESDGDWGGAERDDVAVAKGSQLHNVSNDNPDRWVEHGDVSERTEASAYHTTMQEVGHGLNLCGGCHSEAHGCGMNYDDTYSFDGSSDYPGDSDDYCRTAMECPDDGGPNHCGTEGVDVSSQRWDTVYADGYYWDSCAGDCLREEWN